MKRWRCALVPVFVLLVMASPAPANDCGGRITDAQCAGLVARELSGAEQAARADEHELEVCKAHVAAHATEIEALTAKVVAARGNPIERCEASLSLLLALVGKDARVASDCAILERLHMEGSAFLALTDEARATDRARARALDRVEEHVQECRELGRL